MTSSKALLAVLFCLSLSLAGCTSTTERGTDFTVPKDAASHETVDTGGHTLEVLVTDLDGTPVAGAAVVFFTTSTTQNDWVFHQETVITYESLAGVRTGADGKASATLSPGRQVGVAAGDAEGLTTEVRPEVVLGSAGATSSVTVMLYPDAITHAWDVNVDNMVGRARMQDAEYVTFDMDFGLPDHADALHTRLATAGLDVHWINGPTSGADLFAGFSVDDEEPFLVGPDDQQLPADGAHVESVMADATALSDHRDAISNQGLQAAVLTHWASLGLSGVPVTLNVTATFVGSSFTISG